MNTIQPLSRRQFLLATAGAAVFALSSSRRAGAYVDIYEVVDGPLNLRTGPGLDYSVIAALPYGTQMEIIGDGGKADGYEWAEVAVSSLGRTGFVAMWYIARVTTPVDTDFPVGSTAVTTAALNVRSGAGLTYAIIVTLWAGAPVAITGNPVAASGYTWYPIKTAYGTAGWVAGEFLTVASVPTAEFVVGEYVTPTTALNLRSGAGLTYSVIAVLWEGAQLSVTGGPVAASGYTWYPVETTSGTTGWVAGDYLKPLGTLPSRFPVGSSVQATTSLNLRSDPGLSASIIVVLWPGALLTITGAPVSADGYSWYPVKTTYGTTGWVAGNYLA